MNTNGAMSMIRAIHKVTAPLSRRLNAMIARAVLEAVRDDGNMQLLQVSLLRDELADEVERMQEYGFSSHPLAGAEAACLFVAGHRAHPLVVAVDDRRYRPRELAAGDVIIYTDQDNGDNGPHRILLTREGEIRIATSPHCSVVVRPGVVMASLSDEDGNSTSLSVTPTQISGEVTDDDDNSASATVTSTEVNSRAIDDDGNTGEVSVMADRIRSERGRSKIEIEDEVVTITTPKLDIVKAA